MRYSGQIDLSAQQRNSLHERSQDILAQLDGPVTIQVFIEQQPDTRQAIARLLQRYQQHKADLHWRFIDPNADPATTRELGIASNGELLIEYRQRQERLQQLSEQTLSNALQRLAREQQHWVVFLSGHGERDPYGRANHDYQQLTQRLNQQGFRVQTQALLSQARIPDNTGLLVIAGPRSDYLAAEVDLGD